MNPFDYVNAINFTKEDLMQTDLDSKAYNSFLVNCLAVGNKLPVNLPALGNIPTLSQV